MKKFLLTVALLLAVVTSLTAGTLAAYNQTLSITGTDSIAATHFEFAAQGSQDITTGVKINPGQTKYYQVKIDNKSEVPVDFTATAELSGELKSALTVQVLENASNGTVWSGAKKVQEGKDKTFFVKVTWTARNDAVGNASDVALGKAQAKASLKITVNGTYTNTTDLDAASPDANLT